MSALGKKNQQKPVLDGCVHIRRMLLLVRCHPCHVWQLYSTCSSSRSFICVRCACAWQHHCIKPWNTYAKKYSFLSIMLLRRWRVEKTLSNLAAVRFLSRQGLAFRGDGDEADGNFKQVLLLKVAEDSNLAEWMKRKENVYTSPDIQNEFIKLMYLQVLWDVADDLHASPFLTVMADKTTDCYNREHVTVILCSVT